MDFAPSADNYMDYYAVMESTTPEDDRSFKILKAKETADGISFLRFSSCLQTFYGYNRNRRLWKEEQVRAMSESREVREAQKYGAFVGEMGHPVPATGKVTIERIMTVDPDRQSHRIISFDWSRTKELHGIVETLDEGPGTPGYRFMRNIMQGIVPAFSLRSIVPQRRNADGTIDVIGPGRMIAYDRVYIPSHEGAYMDVNIPVKNITTQSNFQTVMESYVDEVITRSQKVGRILDELEPALESATLDSNGILSVSTKECGRVFVAPETKYRQEIRNLYRSL